MVVSDFQQETLDQMESQMGDFKLTRQQIKQESVRIREGMEIMGNRVLQARRDLGFPEPDPKEFGHQLLKFQIGLRALAAGMQEPNFTIPGIPAPLREWLSNPITDTPATDEELEMHVGLLAEHERQVRLQPTGWVTKEKPKRKRKTS